MHPVLAICLGASAGALLRWLLGLGFEALLAPTHPQLGTLAANLLGGYLIGLLAGLFVHWPGLGQQWGLLLITGFLGSLTTFSAFSLEVTLLLRQGQLSTAGLTMLTHLGGSLLLTWLGLLTAKLLDRTA